MRRDVVVSGGGTATVSAHDRSEVRARPMKPLRIVQVIHGLAVGGMERLLVDLVSRADPRQFEMHVLALHFAGELAADLPPHVKLHVAPPLSRWTMLWPRALTAQLRRLSPDIVHTHGRVWYKAALAARLAGVKRIIHTDHGRQFPDPWRQRLVDRLAARFTGDVVAVSEGLARQLSAHRIRGKRPTRVITNGIDTRLYRPRADDGAIHRELGITPGTPVIGTIGRFNPIKGHRIMIEALAHLRREWAGELPPVLVIVGDGSPEERLGLERQIAELDLRGGVYLPGLRSDVHAFHSAFTIFTLASYSEGTSISLLEAMSAGLCPVVTAVGGNPAVLGPTLAHRLVPAGSASALAAAWRRALTRRDETAADGVTGRQRVRDAFALDALVAAYAQLYGRATTSLALEAD